MARKKTARLERLKARRQQAARKAKDAPGESGRPVSQDSDNVEQKP
jgi:hypothetical protein